MCSPGAVGSKPPYRVTGPASSAWPQLVEVGGLRDQPAPGQLVDDVGHRLIVPPSPAEGETALGRTRGTYGRYTDTVGSPVSQNRHGRSAALLTPTRGPWLTAARRPAPPVAARIRSAEVGSHTSAPSWARSMPRDWHSRAGPRASSRPGTAGRPARRAVRRAAASGTPSMTSARPQQHGRGRAGRQAGQVHAEVHAVGEVHVRVPGRPEHDRVARGAPPVGVRGRVGGALVRLDLGQPHRDQAIGGLVLQHAAQQAWRDLQRVAGEELARQQRVRRHGHATTVSAPPRRRARPLPRAARRAARPPGPARCRRARCGRPVRPPWSAPPGCPG